MHACAGQGRAGRPHPRHHHRHHHHHDYYHYTRVAARAGQTSFAQKSKKRTGHARDEGACHHRQCHCLLTPIFIHKAIAVKSRPDSCHHDSSVSYTHNIAFPCIEPSSHTPSFPSLSPPPSSPVLVQVSRARPPISVRWCWGASPSASTSAAPLWSTRQRMRWQAAARPPPSVLDCPTWPASSPKREHGVR